MSRLCDTETELANTWLTHYAMLIRLVHELGTLSVDDPEFGTKNALKQAIRAAEMHKTRVGPTSPN